MKTLRYRWFMLTTCEMHWLGYSKPSAMFIGPDKPMWGAKWKRVKRWQVAAYEGGGWRRGPLPSDGSFLGIPSEPERLP